MSISIHVPSWGTTGSGRIHCQAAGNFNPRSLVGNDPGSRWHSPEHCHFNPRSLVGNDEVLIWSSFPLADFNPRSLVGNDYIPVGTYTIVEISIHVPSWGTTIFTRRQPPCILFQSTFPRGERRAEIKAFKSLQEFQSTFPRGERQMQGSDGADCKDFNPRSLVGND